MVWVVDGVAHSGHKPKQGDDYIREPTKFGPHEGPLPADSDLYLYVCAACPWAHRALITRNMSPTLREKIKVCVVSPFRDDDLGWELVTDNNREKYTKALGQTNIDAFTVLPPTADSSPLQADKLLDIYLKASPKYTGNITTPTLYDAKSNTIISNDSFSIMRNLVETAPDEMGYMWPAAVRETMDAEARELDMQLCKRVYMCCLAKTQEAYSRNAKIVFTQLDELEGKITSGFYADGDQISLVDIQLIACLVRFDAVYFDLFKCYTRRIASYPNLSAYVRRVVAAIGDERLSLDMKQILAHYWTTFTDANPKGVVPIAYQDDFFNGGIDKYRDDTDGLIPEGVVSGTGVAGHNEKDAEANKVKVAKGEFVRGASAHRNWLGEGEFPLEEGRYVLFVANNCPWCHRTMMARAIYSGIKKYVDACTMFYRRGGPDGCWQFLPSDESELRQFEIDNPEFLSGVDKQDPTGNNFQYAPEIYKLSDPESTQKSVPILFDKKTKKVVSNESADIVRMFAMITNSFDDALLDKIDAVNARVYNDINNGAYKAGFSANQIAYEESCATYFKALDWVNNILAKTAYLVTDDKPTEADLRLFPTIFRHDAVYHSRMKLNVAMVRDYPHLNRWFLAMKAQDGVMEGSNLSHCLAGYFGRTGNNLVPLEGLEHDGERQY